MLVDSKSTETTVVMSPARLAASIDASPVATMPSTEFAQARPVFVAGPAWLVAVTGPPTLPYMPDDTGARA